MKKCKVAVIWVAVLLLIWRAPVCAEEGQTIQEPSELYARSAVLMDADSGRVLFGKEENAVRPMASTTKIMTCILALEHMEEGQIAAASANAAGQPKVRLGVKDGEEYHLSDLLYSLMLESHNDSAVVVAETISGSVEEFARLMNEKAGELGCADTHFVTPNGLDAFDEGGTHSTTARDLARIMKYCITESPKKEEFLEITRTKAYSFQNVEKSRQFTCSNHNAFLDMMEGALTGKTGFTGDAGYCYVGALQNGGRTFIVALLACGWPNNKGYKWQDTRKLMEYGIGAYTYRDVWEEPPLSAVYVENGVPEDDSPWHEAFVPVKIKDPDRELKILLREDETVETQYKVKSSVRAPVKNGQKIGSIVYRLAGEPVRQYEIVTSAKVQKRTFGWCLGTIAGELFLAP